MTAYTLIAKHLEKNPGSHFFDSDTLKFFGERMSEMNVLKKTEHVKSADGFEHEVYVLSSLQHKYPGGARRVYHYFDTQTFEHIVR